MKNRRKSNQIHTLNINFLIVTAKVTFQQCGRWGESISRRQQHLFMQTAWVQEQANRFEIVDLQTQKSSSAPDNRVLPGWALYTLAVLGDPQDVIPQLRRLLEACPEIKKATHSHFELWDMDEPAPPFRTLGAVKALGFQRLKLFLEAGYSANRVAV